MRFWDKTTIALRSIINNKSRSILTIIIIFIVSSLILSIMMIALNFANNSYKISELSVRNSRSYIGVNRYHEEEYRNPKSAFTSEETLAMIDVIKENKYIFNDISFDAYNDSQNYFLPNNNKKMTFDEFYKSNYHSYYISNKATSFHIPFGVPNAVVDGRIWNENDVNTNHVWVSDNFINKAYLEGVILGVGSKIWVNNFFRDYQTSEYSFYTVEYEITGIILTDSITAYIQSLKKLYPNLYYWMDSNIDIYCDMSYLANSTDAFPYFNSLSMTYLPPTSSYDFNQLYETVDNVVDEFVDITKTTKPIVTSAYSSIIEEFKMIKIINAFIVGLAIGLGMLVLLLSIGSVANTIIISVDKNKKFIGLTKALGLKQNEVEDIVRIEATITIILGIILATAGVFLGMSFFKYLNTTLINSVFSYQLKELEYTIITSVPAYLPIGVGVIFLLMTLLFSKSSLKTISKMDVITIISEVS